MGADEQGAQPMTEMDEYVGRVQVIIWDATDYLSRQAVEYAQRLADHGEAPEGMLALAWAIVNEDAHVPRSLIERIRSHAADLVPEEAWPPGLDDHAIANGAG